MEAPYSEQHVARLLRVLSVCIPRPQLQRRLSAPEVQWVPSRASKGTSRHISRYISPASPLHLPYISPISPLHLTYISQVALLGDQHQLPPTTVARHPEALVASTPLFTRLLTEGVPALLLDTQVRGDTGEMQMRYPNPNPNPNPTRSIGCTRPSRSYLPTSSTAARSAAE